MPSATSVPQFSLTNLGPLTTTFTADAACATSGGTQIGLQSPAGAALFPTECTVSTLGPCFPSGSKVDARASSIFSQVGNFAIHYFSPGIVCPSGWSTAGVVVKSADGSVSTSGIFEAPAALKASKPAEELGLNRLFNPVVNVFTAAIDPGETGVVCCPTYDLHAWGFCVDMIG